MNDLVSIFLLGALYGTTVCSFSCLGYLAPMLLVEGRGWKDGLLRSLCFVGGKIFCYCAFGALAACLGRQVSLSPHAAAALSGLFVVGCALWLLFSGKKQCRKKCVSGNLSFVALGMSTSLVPCPPLLAILVMAAASGNLLYGAVSGIMFGLGLLVSPMLPVSAGLGHMSQRLKGEIGDWLPWLRGAAALVIAVSGLRMLLGGI